MKKTMKQYNKNPRATMKSIAIRKARALKKARRAVGRPKKTVAKTATKAPVKRGRPRLALRPSTFFRSCMGLNEDRAIVDPKTGAIVRCTKAARNDSRHVRRFSVSHHPVGKNNRGNLTSKELRAIFC